MAYDVRETGDLTRSVEFSVPADEFKSRINRALKEIADDVDISGFRKGKVPMSVLQQRFGQRVRPEVIENLIRENIQEAAEEFQGRLLHVGETQVTQIPEEDEPLEFKVDFELQPELDPVGYLGLTVDKPEPEVSDEEVDQRLEQMREEFATLEPIELRSTIQTGDIVTFDFGPVSEDANVQEFAGEDVQAEIGSGQVLPAIEEGLEGADFHSTITVDIEADENFPIEELRGESIPLEVDIKSVKQKILPRLDDEFAKDTGEAQTLLELRTQVRDQLRDQKSHRAEHLAMENLDEALIEQNEVPLPPTFVAEQVDQEIERREQMFEQQGIDPAALGANTDEFREETRKQVERNLKSEFLLLAIAEKEGFEVEEEDIDAFFEHQAEHDQRFSADQLKQFMRQNEEQWQQVQYQALMEKTRDFLLEEADLEPAPWPDEGAMGPGAAAEDEHDDEETSADDETDSSDEE